jgi:hypothetical protein
MRENSPFDGDGREMEHRVDAFYAHDFVEQTKILLQESVLRTPVGGPAVMADQLSYLLRMSVRRYLTLRVVPHLTRRACRDDRAFRLMEFAEFKPVA